MAKKKKRGKGRGWHGDSAGHSAAARKSGSKGKKAGGKKKSFAKKLGMTDSDLAKHPGTKAHLKKKLSSMGVSSKQHRRAVKNNWKRMIGRSN